MRDFAYQSGAVPVVQVPVDDDVGLEDVDEPFTLVLLPVVVEQVPPVAEFTQVQTALVVSRTVLQTLLVG